MSLLHAGMEISGDWFSDTDFADDIATMDVDPRSLAATLVDMEHACRDLGLHISWSKTKIQNATSVLDLQLKTSWLTGSR